MAHAGSQSSSRVHSSPYPQAIALAKVARPSKLATVRGTSPPRSLALAEVDVSSRQNERARASHDELRRIVKIGQATEEQVAELAAAKVTLASAEADVATALDALHTAGVATLSTP